MIVKDIGLIILIVFHMVIKYKKYKYIMIDLHKAIGKLPIIPKRGLTLPNMHYRGPYNPLIFTIRVQ